MKTSNKIFIFLISFSYLFFGKADLTAQHFDIGYEYGFSSYFGDLAPFTAVPSMAKSSSSKGFYFGYGNKNFTIMANYTVMDIFASDRNADRQSRVDRNLDFRSPINEYGLTAEVNVLGLFSKKYTRLQPLLISGINVFTFDPYTTFQDEIVYLQPLGTEGQGSAAFPDKEKYSLTQISIPLGAGVKFQLTKNLWLGAGAKLRWTFTDYLDDVSDSYVDPEILLNSNGSLSAELAFRSDELDPNNSVNVGTNRGNPTENDWYMTTYISFGIRLDKAQVIPSKQKRKRSTKRVKCPTFGSF
jgi:hypothetical protein